MSRFLPRWPLLLLVPLGWLLGSDLVRVGRIDELTALPDWTVDRPAEAPASPTGYRAGTRMLLVPDPTGRSQQWIAQTEILANRGGWRLREVGYDNAPHGRETRFPTAYRLWLRVLSAAHGQATGAAPGRSVEWAARWADPFLHLAGLAAVVGFVATWFGGASAIGAAVLLTFGFPLATAFAPGLPDSRGMALLCALATVLPLVAAGRRGARPPPHPNRLAWASALAGGLGLWIDPSTQAPVLGTVILAALLSHLYVIRKGSEANAGAAGLGLTPANGRTWGLVGTATVLASLAVDCLPGGLARGHELVPALCGLGWLAAGFGLHARPEHDRGRLAVGLLTAAVALAGVALPLCHPVLRIDLDASHLTRIDGGLAHASLLQWVRTGGLSLPLFATLLPAVLILVAVVPRRSRPCGSPALRFALAAVPAALLLGVAQLRAWGIVDVLLIPVVVVWLAPDPRWSGPPPRWGWLAAGAAVAGLGALASLPPQPAFRPGEFSSWEIQALIERDLAHALSQRAPGAVVLAPPALTQSLLHYGGLQGIATADIDNRAGLLASARIAAARSSDEAQRLLESRHVTHLVLPSWDSSLEDAAALSGGADSAAFIMQLRAWQLPLWLRPVPYEVPAIEGLAERSLVVLEVVPEQAPATALSRMAAYFLATGRPEYAIALREYLRRHPLEMDALASLAAIEQVRGDSAAFAEALQSVELAIEAGADEVLEPDRRLALAVLLQQSDRPAAARRQLARCWEQLDAAQLRRLTAPELFRLIRWSRLEGAWPADPHLGEFAVRLLPADLREKL